MEVKRIGMEWYEKLDGIGNELPGIDELLAVDKDLAECDNILSEIGLQTGYNRYENRIYEIGEKRVHLRGFIMDLPTYIDVYLDEPFRQKLNHGASEIISRIHMADFQVENTLGLMVVPINSNYMGKPQKKDKLSLEDFIGSALRKEAKGNSIPGINHECVEEFAAIFKQQYDNLLAMGMLGEDSQKLEKYLDQFVSQGEYNHKEDQPFGKLLLTNLLDLTIIKPIIESCCGYDLITEEDLTDMERSLKLVFAIVDLVTLATGLYGFTLVAETMGAKEAVAYFARLAMVELAADVSATTVATIGEYCEWPAGLTILLSLGTGLTVGQVGNHLIFKQNGIEIFRKEVSEDGGFLNGNEVSLEDLKPLEGLEEIGKADDALSLSSGVNEWGLEPGTLSNVDARKWYLEQEAKIPNLIDDSLPLEQQARQAFDLRNQYRTQARELMSDRELAASLYKSDPNLTWEQVIQKQIDKGLSGEDIYKAIIESSQRSRKSVNQSLGLE